MKNSLKLLLALLIVVSCSQVETETQQYSIETLMSNNRSSGGYFSKDGVNYYIAQINLESLMFMRLI